jgi:hypothetical protein
VDPLSECICIRLHGASTLVCKWTQKSLTIAGKSVPAFYIAACLRSVNSDRRRVNTQNTQNSPIFSFQNQDRKIRNTGIPSEAAWNAVLRLKIFPLASRGADGAAVKDVVPDFGILFAPLWKLRRKKVSTNSSPFLIQTDHQSGDIPPASTHEIHLEYSIFLLIV